MGRKPSPHPRACALCFPSPVIYGTLHPSYWVPALSFALEALKGVGRAPSTSPADRAPDILPTWVGAPQPSLLESRAPLSLCRNNSFAVYAGALLGSTIDSSLSRAPLIPPPRNSDRLSYWYRGGPKREGVSYVHHGDLYIRNLIPIDSGLPPRGPGLSGTGPWGKTNFAMTEFSEVRTELGPLA